MERAGEGERREKVAGEAKWSPVGDDTRPPTHTFPAWHRRHGHPCLLRARRRRSFRLPRDTEEEPLPMYSHLSFYLHSENSCVNFTLLSIIITWFDVEKSMSFLILKRQDTTIVIIAMLTGLVEVDVSRVTLHTKEPFYTPQRNVLKPKGSFTSYQLCPYSEALKDSQDETGATSTSVSRRFHFLYLDKKKKKNLNTVRIHQR